MTHPRILEAIRVLHLLGLSATHQAARDGLALLALLRIGPVQTWEDAQNPLLHPVALAAFPSAYGFRPREDAIKVLQLEMLPAFAAAGIVQVNPDAPSRPRKSSHTLYRVPPLCLNAYGRGIPLRASSSLTAAT